MLTRQTGSSSVSVAAVLTLCAAAMLPATSGSTSAVTDGGAAAVMGQKQLAEFYSKFKAVGGALQSNRPALSQYLSVRLGHKNETKLK